jgi:hypothetical protein
MATHQRAADNNRPLRPTLPHPHATPEKRLGRIKASGVAALCSPLFPSGAPPKCPKTCCWARCVSALTPPTTTAASNGQTFNFRGPKHGADRSDDGGGSRTTTLVKCQTPTTESKFGNFRRTRRAATVASAPKKAKTNLRRGRRPRAAPAARIGVGASRIDFMARSLKSRKFLVRLETSGGLPKGERGGADRASAQRTQGPRPSTRGGAGSCQVRVRPPRRRQVNIKACCRRISMLARGSGKIGAGVEGARGSGSAGPCRFCETRHRRRFLSADKLIFKFPFARAQKSGCARECILSFVRIYIKVIHRQ